jgi:SAM-dependent methyltransferase
MPKTSQTSPEYSPNPRRDLPAFAASSAAARGPVNDRARRGPNAIATFAMHVETLELYRWAVQDPETHAEVLRLMYERARPGSRALVLREDFAGTAAESVAWVGMGKDRRAVAVELDESTVAWARSRAARILGARSSGVDFIAGDSLSVAPPQAPAADIISVLNFSVLYLRERAQLQHYLQHARRCLAPQGVMVVNLLGGAGARRLGVTTHEVTPRPRFKSEQPVAPFLYHWDQRAYDPATSHAQYSIHFTVRDGAEVRDAFTYHWRLWSIDELIHAFREAGFSSATMWRHTYDPSKGANGVFLGPVDQRDVADMDLWTAYIVAAA